MEEEEEDQNEDNKEYNIVTIQGKYARMAQQLITDTGAEILLMNMTKYNEIKLLEEENNQRG